MNPSLPSNDENMSTSLSRLIEAAVQREEERAAKQAEDRRQELAARELDATHSDPLLAHASSVTERMLRFAERMATVRATAGEAIGTAISRLLPYIEMSQAGHGANALFKDQFGTMPWWDEYKIEPTDAGRGPQAPLLSIDPVVHPNGHVFDLLFLDRDGVVWEAVLAEPRRSRLNRLLWGKLGAQRALLRPWQENLSPFDTAHVLRRMAQAEEHLARQVTILEEDARAQEAAVDRIATRQRPSR